MSCRWKAINILGRKYSIKYVNNPVEVDLYKRESLWGQIDYWTRTVRIFDNGRPVEDIFETLLHEIVEGLQEDLNLKSLKRQPRRPKPTVCRFSRRTDT